jgi:hypothetical protein
MSTAGAFLARWLRAAAAALEERSAERAGFGNAHARDAFEGTDSFEHAHAIAAIRRRYPDAPDHWLRFVAERTPGMAASETGDAPAAASNAANATATATSRARPQPSNVPRHEDEAAERRVGRVHRKPESRIGEDSAASRAGLLGQAPAGRLGGAAVRPTRAESRGDASGVGPHFRRQAHVEQLSEPRPEPFGAARILTTAAAAATPHPGQEGTAEKFPLADKRPRVLTGFSFPAGAAGFPADAIRAGTPRFAADRKKVVSESRAVPVTAERAQARLADGEVPPTDSIEPVAARVSARRGAEKLRFAAPSTVPNHEDGGPGPREPFQTSGSEQAAVTSGRPRRLNTAAAPAGPSMVGTAAAARAGAAGAGALTPGVAAGSVLTAGVAGGSVATAGGAAAEAASGNGAAARAIRRNAVIATSAFEEPRWPDLPAVARTCPDSQISAHGPRSYFAAPATPEGSDRWNELPF